jgi:hypothetical protein
MMPLEREEEGATLYLVIRAVLTLLPGFDHLTQILTDFLDFEKSSGRFKVKISVKIRSA